MAIFKVKSKEENEVGTKHVGVILPRHVTSFLTLYCLSKGITKTKVIRELVEKWMYHDAVPSTEDLILDLVSKIDKQWQACKTSSKSSMVMFKEQVSRELKAKDMEEEHIQLILNMLTNGTDEESNAAQRADETER
jgi:hypothetical protein